MSPIASLCSVSSFAPWIGTRDAVNSLRLLGLLVPQGSPWVFQLWALDHLQYLASEVEQHTLHSYHEADQSTCGLVAPCLLLLRPLLLSSFGSLQALALTFDTTLHLHL